MDLKSLQEKYLDLIKDRYILKKDEEDYFRNLVDSKNLKILKDIIHFWRTEGVGNYCTFTSALLQKLGLFDEKVKSYYNRNNFSNYVEEFGRSFLFYTANDENKLISFTAEFESGMIDAQSGFGKDHFIETKYDIYEVFNFIMSDGEFPLEKEEKVIIKISPTIENFFCILNKN